MSLGQSGLWTTVPWTNVSTPIEPLRDPGRPFFITGSLKSASQGPFEGPFWAQEGPLVSGIVAQLPKQSYQTFRRVRKSMM